MIAMRGELRIDIFTLLLRIDSELAIVMFPFCDSASSILHDLQIGYSSRSNATIPRQHMTSSMSLSKTLSKMT
jgi:hypothetical protein